VRIEFGVLMGQDRLLGLQIEARLRSLRIVAPLRCMRIEAGQLRVYRWREERRLVVSCMSWDKEGHAVHGEALVTWMTNLPPRCGNSNVTVHVIVYLAIHLTIYIRPTERLGLGMRRVLLPLHLLSVVLFAGDNRGIDINVVGILCP